MLYSHKVVFVSGFSLALVAFGIMSTCVSSPFPQEDKGGRAYTKEELKSAIVLGIERLRKALENIEIESNSREVTRLPNGKVVTESHRAYCIQAAFGASKVVRELVQEKEVVNGTSTLKSAGIGLYNPKYMAELGNRGDHYVVVQLNKVGARSKPEEISAELIPFDLRVSYFFAQQTVVQLLENENFKFKSAREDDHGRVKLAFSRGTDDLQLILELAPELDWAIVSVVDEQPGYTVTDKLEYQPYGGSYVIKKVVSESTMHGETLPVVREVREFSKPKPCTCDEALFYLSAYGLPEPQEERQPWAIRVLVIAAAIALIVAGVMLWRSRAK